MVSKTRLGSQKRLGTVKFGDSVPSPQPAPAQLIVARLLYITESKKRCRDSRVTDVWPITIIYYAIEYAKECVICDI